LKNGNTHIGTAVVISSTTRRQAKNYAKLQVEIIPGKSALSQQPM